MTDRGAGEDTRRLHTCHARDCDQRVPPKMFMCKRHWYMLPKRMRDAVWDAYVPGQEQRMDPTDEYLVVTQRCIEFVAVSEEKRHVG
jgi:hypothetical protein